jgi:putative ABC transport system permease protein
LRQRILRRYIGIKHAARAVSERQSKNALNGPDKIIMSEDLAHKYFADEDPVGKILTVRDTKRVQALQVTGVFKNYPPNSHLDLQYLVSYAT